MFEWLPWALDQLGNAGDQERAEKLRKRGEQRDDNAIRRRVRDAQLAGIHPLAALGFSAGGGSSPVPFIPTDSGSDYFRKDPNADLQREYMESQIAVLRSEAKRNEVMAAKEASDAARSAQVAGQVRMTPALPLMGKVKEFFTGDSTKAQVWQDEYGDLGENVFGTARLVHDVGSALAQSFSDMLVSMYGKLPPVSARQLGSGR